MLRHTLLSALFTVCIFASEAWASVCEHAVQQAAQRHKVPPQLMMAMALVESGRTVDGKRAGWPWTINVEGQGHYFQTHAEAVAFARSLRERGVTLFDTGCFQINYHWHSKGSPSLDAMFDPVMNAEYAAQFLAALYTEVGDWMTAVGFYHSRTPQYTMRYQKKIVQAMQGGQSDMKSVQMASVNQKKPTVRFLRPADSQKSLQRLSGTKNQLVTLQSLTPQTAGSVAIRILIPSKSLINKRSGANSQIISFKGTR